MIEISGAYNEWKNYKIFDLALKLAKLTRKYSFDDQITITQRILVHVVSDKIISNFYDGFKNFTKGKLVVQTFIEAQNSRRFKWPFPPNNKPTTQYKDGIRSKVLLQFIHDHFTYSFSLWETTDEF